MKYKLNAKLGELEMTKETIMAMKQPLQLREIACYVLATHGVDKELDQKELFDELDEHQTDNAVLSRTPAQPISRVLGFYRGRLDEIGLFTTTKVPREPKEPKAPKLDADGNPIVGKAAKDKTPKKSKRKMLEEATESGSVTPEQAAEFNGDQSAAEQVM